MTHTPPDTDRPAVGDIAYSSWGYEQTNVDYYQVTAVSRAMVTVQPIAAATEATGPYTGVARPLRDQFTGPAIRRKIHHHSDRWHIAINTVANAYPWTGAPNRVSTYA